MTARHCTITGSVQGVGFRAWCRDEAARRHLSGWVRNRESGAVEAVFEGPIDALESMVAALWQGPRGASVDNVEIVETDDKVSGQFSVLPTE